MKEKKLSSSTSLTVHACTLDCRFSTAFPGWESLIVLLAPSCILYVSSRIYLLYTLYLHGRCESSGVKLYIARPRVSTIDRENDVEASTKTATSIYQQLYCAFVCTRNSYMHKAASECNNSKTSVSYSRQNSRLTTLDSLEGVTKRAFIAIRTRRGWVLGKKN